MLSDPGNAYARQLSIVFTLPEELRSVYQGFGIDLPAFNADDSWELPIPARVVVDEEGAIQSVDADPDYTSRPEPDETLAILKRIA